MKKEELLYELECLLRTMPSSESFKNRDEEVQVWLGNTIALVEENDEMFTSIKIQSLADNLNSSHTFDFEGDLNKFRSHLHKVIYKLRISTKSPLTSTINKGEVLNYFDQIRKILKIATKEILVIDPYLNVDFITDYCPPNQGRRKN